MKKITSIFFLILFGIYSFTFKTHYCFYPNGDRFHGDCKEHIHEAEAKGNLEKATFFPQKYYCNDIVKNAQVFQAKITPVKSPFNGLIVTPPVVEIIVPVFNSYYLQSPEPNCRSATIFFSANILRGPPSFV